MTTRQQTRPGRRSRTGAPPSIVSLAAARSPRPPRPGQPPPPPHAYPSKAPFCVCGAPDKGVLGGKLHHLWVDAKGHLCFEHDLKAEAVLIALGGATPRCVEVLRAWRIWSSAELPPGLRPALEVAHAVHDARWERRSREGPPLTPADRLLVRREAIQAAARRHLTVVVAATGLPYHERPGVTALTGASSAFVCATDSRRLGSRIEARRHLTVVVRPSWWALYRQGAATVFAAFVLEVLATEGDRRRVLAVRQSRHRRTWFETAPAWLTQVAGEWRLTWEDQP